jgi:hypothetical protein
MIVKPDNCGAVQMRESDGWRDEDLQIDRRKIGPARGIAFSPRAFCSCPTPSSHFYVNVRVAIETN